MKTIINAAVALLLLLAPAIRSEAAVISWGFNGVLTSVDNPSNALPANVAVDMPFSGFISYDTSKMTSDFTPSPVGSAHYFHNHPDIVITIHVGGTTISTTNRFPGENYGGIGVNNNIADRYDEFWAYSDGGGPLVNGSEPVGAPKAGGIGISFQDNTKTAVTSDVYDNFIPGFPRFERATFSASAFTSGAENQVFYIGGDITEVTLLPKVILTAKPLPGNQLRLSWPVSATGLTLQFATSLTAQDWTTEPTAVVDTATEHTVTVSTTGQPKFFRLVKLP